MRIIIFSVAALILTGCFSIDSIYTRSVPADDWGAKEIELAKKPDVQALRRWWRGFNDESLNTLVSMALTSGPDREIARARVREARGLRQTSASYLWPQITADFLRGREENGINNKRDFYDGSFDASFEVDVFGRFRNQYDAASPLHSLGT